MRKLFLFFCCILYSQLNAQTTYVFNVELNDKANAPTFNKIKGKLVYSGSNSAESTFFANYTITSFYATYPHYSGYLQNVFTFVTSSSTLINDLKTNFPAKYLKTEDLTGMQVQLVSTYPNDYGNGVNYYNPTTNLGANISMKSFDYVNAPKAWGFFPNNKGNVTIGISDGMVNNSDADFGSKVSYLHSTSFNSTYDCTGSGFEARHGTAIGAIAAAQGNNANGMAGICYDCKILNIPYTIDVYTPNYDGLMEMALLGVKVINMSWIQGYNFNDPSYISGRVDTQQDAINQLHEMGVVLVAGAGNATSYQTAAMPSWQVHCYPASYDHVISVTVVHAKNHNLTDELTGPVATYGYISNYNEDIICVNGGIGNDLSNPSFVPFIEWSTTTNSKVDICAPAYAPLFPEFTLGCPNGIYGDTTSCATPFVTGTVALMQTLNSCILPDEVEDVLQLASKNLEKKPENAAFVGRSGSGKLETGDAVEFTYEMMNASGNAVIDGQDFWRFEFNLQHINNKLTISNQKFRDGNKSSFKAKNVIDVLTDCDFRPNSNGFVDLKIDGALTVCGSSPRMAEATTGETTVARIKSAQLYPNPNKGSFTIRLNQNEVKDLEVTVFDIIGKPVYQTKTSQNEFDLSLQSIPSGVYLVKLNSNTINETLKFIKE